MKASFVLQSNSTTVSQMALLVLFLAVGNAFGAATSSTEMSLANVTRYSPGDLFSLIGSDCGPTRCMEVSHGTALAAMDAGDVCSCQCRRDTPAFREDQRICVDQVDDLEDSICAVTSAQYLTKSGWVTLRDMDNDVPFSLYRDEGSTFLQWRGSASLHTRLEGRLVTAHVLCSSSIPERFTASCAAFRIAGATQNILLDVRSIPFHAGEVITTEPVTQNQGLSVLESLAIGVCVLMLIFVYAAGIIFYVHYKKRQKRKEKDPEINNTLSTDNDSTLDSRIDLDNIMLKTNPLLKMENYNIGTDYMHEAGLSDVSEHTEDTIDSSSTNTEKFQKMNSNVVSAMVHTRRKKPTRPTIRATSTPDRLTERLQRRSASPEIERAPHSDLSIVDFSDANHVTDERQPSPPNGEVIRRKLYFNPVFFESEHLKNPPPAAVEFILKIREVMSIAKEKMTSRRFIPILSDIPEEESYHTIDLGWDIPCARRGRRFSAISLKRENSRKAIHCGGCPGCDNREPAKSVNLTRSNSCKTCVSEDYKHRVVQKWLDEVPSPAPRVIVSRPVKSIAKVSGTPRVIGPKDKDEPRLSSPETTRSEEVNVIEELVVDPKEKLDRVRSSEPTLKKNFKGEKPKIIHHVPLDIDSGMKNKNIHNGPVDKAIPILKVQERILAKPLSVSMTTRERKSPPKQSLGEIRKKLPPPPPPPTIPPKPLPKDEDELMPPEIKMKMEAVIKELNKCRRVEPIELKEVRTESTKNMAPKLVIPVIAADYYSDDDLLSDSRRKYTYVQREPLSDFENFECNANIMKKRRFSLACGTELQQRGENGWQDLQSMRDNLTRSWRDLRKEDRYQIDNPKQKSGTVTEVFVDNSEPLYDNILKPGSLTILVRGSPIENRRNDREEFDPDTLDRKPKRETKKRVEKILLKSGGSFKHKSVASDVTVPQQPTEPVFSRKIGSLRQIYEAKAKTADEELRMPYYGRRGSLPYGAQDLTALVKSVKAIDMIRSIEGKKDVKPPIPPKQRRGSIDSLPKFGIRESPPGEKRRSPEERERYQQYLRGENLKRSGRRTNRTRSRRTDLRKLYRTEDSGYLSTDSNESKRRAGYLMQLRPKFPDVVTEPPTPTGIVMPMLQFIESDTDESVCDGRSESGGESIETDSVFFGNFDESKEMLADLEMTNFDIRTKLGHHEQIDSGFMGETNIILSGDSDSEHKSIISIVTGRDGRASATSVTQLDDTPYVHSVEC